MIFNLSKLDKITKIKLNIYCTLLVINFHKYFWDHLLVEFIILK